MEQIKQEQPNNKIYTVEYDEAALRDLKKLSKQDSQKILTVIKGLAQNPRPTGVELLTKFQGLYRVRAGNYRIVYSIQDDKLIVVVAAVADRKAIYEVLERRYN